MPTKPVNHVLHIILTILTAGIWLIVYIPILIADGSRKKKAYNTASLPPTTTYRDHLTRRQAQAPVAPRPDMP